MVRSQRIILALTVGLIFIVPVSSSNAAHGASIAANPDFDGDGYGDIAIAALGEDGGAGAVHVLYGSATGPIYAGSDYFTQDSPGVRGVARPNQLFGYSIATGDLDGDGYDDMVVGAPGDRYGTLREAGSIHFFEGSPTGLRPRGALLAGSPALTVPHSFEWFGTALAVGDYNKDAKLDLAVSTPWDLSSPGVYSGSVSVFYGAESGLDTTNALHLTKSKFGWGPIRDDDRFGYALATLRSATGFDGLAIGIPGQDVRDSDGGGVLVLRGIHHGFRGAEGVGGAYASNTGFALAAGDLDGDGNDDLAIGEPGYQHRSGRVRILLLEGSDRTAWIDYYTHQNRTATGVSRPNELFGFALAIGDRTLYIGTPLDVRGGVRGSGSVYVHEWSNDHSRGQSVFVHPISAPTLQRDGEFGAALITVDVTNDGARDLIVGAPGEAVNNRPAAGAVYWYDSDGSPTNQADARIHQATGGVADGPERDDEFGSILSMS